VLFDDCTYCLEKIRLNCIYVSRFFTVADLEEFSIEKDEPLGFEEKIIFIINHIVDELNSNQTLLTFISKNLSWGIFKEALTTKVASDDINFKDVYYEMINAEDGILK